MTRTPRLTAKEAREIDATVRRQWEQQRKRLERLRSGKPSKSTKLAKPSRHSRYTLEQAERDLAEAEGIMAALGITSMKSGPPTS